MASFTPPTITGGPASNVGSAAGIVNLGNTYASLRRNAPRYDEIAATGIATRASERALASQLSGMEDAAKIAADADIKVAKLVSRAQKSAAAKQARGSMIGSAFGAIGTIGGALLAGPAGAAVGGSLLGRIG